jgi:phage gp29-like protein
MPKAKAKPEKNEIATAEKDIDIFAGWINRLENPDPILRTESAGKGIRLYDEVKRDAHAGGVLSKRYRTVVAKEWEVIPASEDKRDIDIADFVERVLLTANFDLGRERLLSAVLYGFAVSEVMWGVSEGDIWVDKFLDKHQRRFIFDLDRNLRLLTWSAMIDGEPVPDRKFIHFQFGSADNPYGEGLGQQLWWPVWFKKNGIKFWVMFAEKFGGPTAVGKYPSGTKKEDQDLLLDAIKAIHQETGVIIPEQMAIDLLEATRTGTVNTYESLLNFMNAEISKCVLGGTLTTEIGKTGGAYSAAETQMEAELGIVKADADALCMCLNGSVIRWLVDYNFPDVREYPKVWIRVEPPQDLKSLAERDRIIFKDLGVPVGKKYFYETYGVPDPEPDEELLIVPMAPNPVGFDEGERARRGERNDGGTRGRGDAEKGQEFAEMTPAQEEAMEKERQRLVSQYFDSLRRSVSGLREDGLAEIQDVLLKSKAMTEEEFTSKTYAILQENYSGISRDDVRRAITPVYSFYRLSDKSAWMGATPAVGISFDSVDRGTIEALGKIDTYYLSKFIENQDMQGPVMKFVQEKYLEQGEGLFGRGSADAIGNFRAQFAGQLAHLEDWQIRRIIDTSVTRMRSLGDLRQAVRAGAEMRVYVTRGERACDICRPRHGEVIKAQKMEVQMLTAAKDPEKFGVFNEVPPFHPNCVCRLVMNI